MRVFRSDYSLLPEDARVVATLGNFDGVHVGHRQLVQRVLEIRDEYRRAGQTSVGMVITFYPHPVSVLKSSDHMPLLSTPRQRIRLFADLGVDFVNPLHFTHELAEMSAEHFIETFLQEKARVSDLIVGPDARVGKGGKGDLSCLSYRMSTKGARVHVVPETRIGGVRVRSGAIRRMILRGELEQARVFLGRPFSYEGRVTAGKGRGRELSFPTINLVPGDQVYPPVGVYVTEVKVEGGGSFHSVTNVGTGPTFGGTKILLETFLLAYEGPSLLGRWVEVGFLKRLRDEVRFPDAEALKHQIAQDVEAARKFFVTGT